MTNWSTRVETTTESIHAVQSGLTVRLIMTPREELTTCDLDPSTDALKDAEVKGYSILPVVQNDVITGLYHTDHRIDAPEIPIGMVCSKFEPLNENHLIGSNADILDFIKTGVERPMRLVLSGRNIEGLVNMADLHKLPVRAALFSLVTGLEMAMAARIDEAFKSNANEWLDLLSDCRRSKVIKRIEKANRNDTFVSDINYTEFADKATIVRKQELVNGYSKSQLEKEFKAIRKLRDSLSHANDYAATPSAAKKVVYTVNTILRLVKEINKHGARGSS